MNQENFPESSVQEKKFNLVNMDLNERAREQSEYNENDYNVPYDNSDDVRNWWENHNNIMHENAHFIETTINPVPLDHQLYQWSNGYDFYSFPYDNPLQDHSQIFEQPQIFLERRTNLPEPVSHLSDDDDSVSEFSDTESSSAEMMEIPDGEIVLLFNGSNDVLLTSDFSSGEEWSLEE